MSGACPQCERRSWLLEQLSVGLDFRARELSRFWSLLELPDAKLIDAIGGRRRAELQTAYAQWEPKQARAGTEIQMICQHHGAYPTGLRDRRLAPHMLGVHGGLERLAGTLEERVVAIVGTRKASDYGMETARSLAYSLTASGVTVASGLMEGIASAVHSGALEASGATLTVMAGGLERCSPAHCSSLYRRVISSGCAISETPSSLRALRWGESARARTLALLAHLVIVVEAEEHPLALACAHLARALGRPVAAVPGRVCSPASRGTNSLLMEGARLIRDPQDALDLLYGVGMRRAPKPSIELEPQLQKVLEEVGEGKDTVAKLTTRGAKPTNVALALTELELQGLLLRGDGGRYVPSAARPDKRAPKPGYLA
ncbi:MAG: DNA-processing protein DprA [Solirubrobacteraceae bacterium]